MCFSAVIVCCDLPRVVQQTNDFRSYELVSPISVVWVIYSDCFGPIELLDQYNAS